MQSTLLPSPPAENENHLSISSKLDLLIQLQWAEKAKILASNTPK